MAKYTLKILQSEQRKIYEVCLANFQYYAWKRHCVKTVRVVFKSNIKSFTATLSLKSLLNCTQSKVSFLTGISLQKLKRL